MFMRKGWLCLDDIVSSLRVLRDLIEVLPPTPQVVALKLLTF